MAYNTKSIVKDVNQKPAPQLYSPTKDAYEVIQGENGASRIILYDIAGNAIDLEALISSVVTAINTTGTTQLRAGADIIGKVDINTSTLPTGASTAQNQLDIKTLVQGVIDTLNLKQLAIGASTSSKQDELKSVANNIYNRDTTKTTYGKSTETKPTNASVGDKYIEINTTDIYIFDGTNWIIFKEVTIWQ